jgi:hypothetical protein
MKRITKKNMKKSLPVQAAPVQRVLHTSIPVATGQQGVEANFLSMLLPVAAGALKGAISSI